MKEKMLAIINIIKHASTGDTTIPVENLIMKSITPIVEIRENTQANDVKTSKNSCIFFLNVLFHFTVFLIELFLNLTFFLQQREKKRKR